ncbi:protease inhibitor I42 family protein [Clostridium felsineum]|uniref:protease inhibitor I42 family protein n=1 Tax=Clostridium felsineum TaxID=36839 RepID=UPI00214D90FC|nr:protease inhibitor I42 family protein [Clostridium felsineum]
MDIPVKNSNNLVGVDYTRKNFYFKPLKKGSQPIVFKYVNKNKSVSNCFTVTINVTIN